MYRIARGTTPNLNDTAEFIELINSGAAGLGDFFSSGADIFVARAPGRLDVMGGIADYSGSLVLEMPIAEATFAALQKSAGRQIAIVSLTENENLFFDMSLSDLMAEGKAIEYEAARQFFSKRAENRWAAYVAGVFLVLMREREIDFASGARILISSKIPPGKGVSSSAALETATMQAVCAAFNIEIEPRRLALLCQKVENLVVGAPCGVMDQMTSLCGVENNLISLLCQPAELQEVIEIPEEIEFWGIDSGVRHAVSGADYASVRVGAFMGYRIICEEAGLEAVKAGNGLVEIEDPRWGGYLANVSPSEFEQFFSAKIPEKLSGMEFLGKYQGTTDPLAEIDPEKIYPVRQPAAHAVDEHFRVRAFAELLKGAVTERRLETLGELMFQSHASYSACGLGERGTDLLVESVRARRGENLYGAKITGGGSGGTVAVLGRRGSRPVISEIAEKYEREIGLSPFIFQGSSPGGFSFGFLRLEKS